MGGPSLLLKRIGTWTLLGNYTQAATKCQESFSNILQNICGLDYWDKYMDSNMNSYWLVASHQPIRSYLWKFVLINLGFNMDIIQFF